MKKAPPRDRGPGTYFPGKSGGGHRESLEENPPGMRLAHAIDLHEQIAKSRRTAL